MEDSYWKTYYHNNQEICRVRNKKWREQNNDKLKESYKKYWETKGGAIKERRKEKINCEICNCEVTRESMTRHKISKKHLENIEKLKSNETV